MHCAGSDNPADLLSRGGFVKNLVASENWLLGSKSLLRSHKSVRISEFSLPVVGEICQLEEKEQVIALVESYRQVSVLKVTRWSSFVKAIRIVGWEKRFVGNLKSEQKIQKGELTNKELSVAKLKLFGYIQQLSYVVELEFLRKGQVIPRSSHIFRLNPVIGTDGVLRIKGRSDLMMKDIL